MPLSGFVRGLIGAIGGLVATSILLLSLAETRTLYSKTQWGVHLVALSHWQRYATFYSVWSAILLWGAIHGILGYTLGCQLHSRRHATFALVTATLAVAIALLNDRRLVAQFGHAGVNTVWLQAIFAALAGGCLGAWVAERWARRTRRRIT